MLECVKRPNFWYNGPAIKHKRGLTEQECADLAASNKGGNFWSFLADEDQEEVVAAHIGSCWVRRSDSKLVPRNSISGTEKSTTLLVSGNRACGTTSNDSTVDSLFMKTCMWVCCNMLL